MAYFDRNTIVFRITLGAGDTTLIDSDRVGPVRDERELFGLVTELIDLEEMVRELIRTRRRAGQEPSRLDNQLTILAQLGDPAVPGSIAQARHAAGPIAREIDLLDRVPAAVDMLHAAIAERRRLERKGRG